MTKTDSNVRSLAEGLWVIDHPFAMPGGIAIGTRSTIVRLSSGGLWLHSPGPLSTSARAWLEANGPVEAIVAPNLLHHLFVPAAASAFPDAAVFGAEGMAKKISGGLEPASIVPMNRPWKDDFECLRIEGSPKMNEVVFFHRSTRTLVMSDLAFNFRRVDSFGTRLFLRLNGALGNFGPSRLARSFFFSDHEQVGQSIAQLLEWNFDRVILAHGEVLETEGHAAMRSAYAWLLD